MESIGKHISYIYRHQSILINERMKEYDIGTGQYLFLINLQGREGINQKELGEILKIDRANTNRAIKKLGEKGFVRSEIDSNDKRNRKLYLTKKGQDVLPLIKGDLDEMTKLISKGVDEVQLKIIFEVFEIFEANVEKEVARIRKERINEG